MLCYDSPLHPSISVSPEKWNYIESEIRNGGNGTDLLAGRASRKAKRTKGMLTRQKEKSEWWESRREEMLAKNPNLD